MSFGTARRAASLYSTRFWVPVAVRGPVTAARSGTWSAVREMHVSTGTASLLDSHARLFHLWTQVDGDVRSMPEIPVLSSFGRYLFVNSRSSIET